MLAIQTVQIKKIGISFINIVLENSVEQYTYLIGQSG